MLIEILPAWMLVFSLGQFHPAWAGDHVLFSPGPRGRPVPVVGFDQAVSGLHAGETVVFSDGTKVILGPLLSDDRGSTTRVFALKDRPGQAIRLPLNQSVYNEGFIDEFVDGQRVLEAAGVPTVQVHQSLGNEYAIVDRLPSDLIPFDRFASDPGLDETFRKRMASALVEFARKTALFSEIGDFGNRQMAYLPSRNSWVLFDWTAANVPGLVRKGRSGNVKHAFGKESAFDRFFHPYLIGPTDLPAEPGFALLKPLQKEIRSAIAAERKKILADPSHALNDLLEVDPDGTTYFDQEKIQASCVRRSVSRRLK